ncbi:MAG TPA: hypothetical protein PLL30_07680 [Candidatus Krumholzibacteria bacterium]|nr:hypothetical protein [Candidatus Krumholzibacteria bacterium]HPD71636.1 hypothetical protein [Candidatus Krumholzibacteria bacterium]HRY41431.1 hypothetical protein [Candidatus Krumholzibacteria bacterium]
MAPLPTISADVAARERRLLDRLLGLYGEQQRLYAEVLELSRHERDLLRDGAPLDQVRGLLAAKKRRLETIGRLDLTEAASREQWRQGRRGWSADGRTRLHRALEDVGQLIEAILACEEENDRELLQQCR